MKQILFILMLCASPGLAQVVPFVVAPAAAVGGAVTFDDSVGIDVDATSFTVSLTVSSNSNRFLLVQVRAGTSGGDPVLLDSMKFNSISMTRVDSMALVPATDGGFDVWRLDAPATGTHDVQGWGSGANYIYGSAACYYNVYQGGGSNTIAIAGKITEGSTTTTHYSTISSATNEMVTGIVSLYDPYTKGLTEYTGCTGIWDGGGQNGSQWVAYRAGAASVSFGWTTTTSTIGKRMVLRIKPASSSPDTTVVVDNFNRASIGSNWVQRTGTFAIHGDTSIKPTVAATEHIMYFDPWIPPDSQYAVTIHGVYGAANSVQEGPAVRISGLGDTSCYGLRMGTDDQWVAYRMIHGTSTTLGSGTDALAAGDSLKLIAKGDSIVAWHNTTRLGGWVYEGVDKLRAGRVGICGYGNATTPQQVTTYWRGGKYVP